MERYSQTMRFYTVSMLVIIRSESCIWTILLGNTFSHSKRKIKTSAWKINVQAHDAVLLSAGVLHTLCSVMSSGAFFFFFKSAAKNKLPVVTSLSRACADVAPCQPTESRTAAIFYPVRFTGGVSIQCALEQCCHNICEAWLPPSGQISNQEYTTRVNLRVKFSQSMTKKKNKKTKTH